MSRLASCELGFLHTAPVRVRRSATIAVGGEQLFSALAENPASWGRWCPGFTTASCWLSARPYGVGSQRRMRAFGTHFTETVLAWDPGARFAFRIDECGIPLMKAFIEDWTLKAATGKHQLTTRATWSIGVEAAIPTAILRTWLSAQQAAMMRIAAARLERMFGPPTEARQSRTKEDKG